MGVSLCVAACSAFLLPGLGVLAHGLYLALACWGKVETLWYATGHRPLSCQAPHAVCLLRSAQSSMRLL